MARPQRCRRVCQEPAFHAFSPEGRMRRETITLTVDEYEMIRLVDLEKKTHEQCATIMQISRSTATEIYESARTKVAEALVHGKQLVIEGGNYRLCDGSEPMCCGHCRRFDTHSDETVCAYDSQSKCSCHG